MVKNIGSIDRIVRVALALTISGLMLTKQISGIAAIIVGILAVIFVITGLVSFCPLYFPFKISTQKRQV